MFVLIKITLIRITLIETILTLLYIYFVNLERSLFFFLFLLVFFWNNYKFQRTSIGTLIFRITVFLSTVNIVLEFREITIMVVRNSYLELESGASWVALFILFIKLLKLSAMVGLLSFFLSSSESNKKI